MHGRNVGPVVRESHVDERWPTFREREAVSGSSLDHSRWGPRSSTNFGRRRDRGAEQLGRGVRGSSFYMQGRNEGHHEGESRVIERWPRSKETQSFSRSSPRFGGRDRRLERFDGDVHGSSYDMLGRKEGRSRRESEVNSRWPTSKEHERISMSSYYYSGCASAADSRFGERDRGVERGDRGVRESSFREISDRGAHRDRRGVRESSFHEVRSLRERHRTEREHNSEWGGERNVPYCGVERVSRNDRGSRGFRERRRTEREQRGKWGRERHVPY